MDSASVDFLSIPGVTLSTLGGICWLIARYLGHEARKIESAKECTQLSDLHKVVGEGPLLTAVSGVVSAHKSHKAELSQKDCVITEFKLQQHVSSETRFGLVEKIIPMRTRTREARGWTITDSTGVHLPVLRGASANFQFDSVESLWEGEKYFQGGNWVNGIANAILDGYHKVHILGHTTTESSLTVGTPVTIVGEVARVRRHTAACASAVMVGSDGMLVMQKPSKNGDPFYITTQTLPELVASISSSASMFKWASIGIGGIGVGLLTWKAARGGITLFRRRKLRARVLKANCRIAADRAAGRVPEGQAPEADNGTEDPTALCCICMESPADAVFTVCGHLCTCWSCSRRAGNRCPMCRTASPSIQVYR